jgi:hypothetical protein
LKLRFFKNLFNWRIYEQTTNKNSKFSTQKLASVCRAAASDLRALSLNFRVLLVMLARSHGAGE